jgi:putative phosphoesterase
MSASRIALISDLHGNEVALAAVLADIRARGVDGIACLGDVATLGPRPREVVQRLRAHGAWFILGNHDEYLFAPQLVAQHTREPAVLDAVAWCRDQLDADDVRFVQGFERRRELSLGAAGNLLLFHGSPADNDHDLLVDTPEQDLVAALAPHAATVMAGGHTHLPMLRQHRGTLLVNPGSVGLPFQRHPAGGPPTIMPYAEYGVVEARGGSVTVALHRVALDAAALLAAARAWDTPLGTYLAAQYQRTV